jgi:D-glycero-D-manno-heptose 1,7-bisphosphate phosphatase
MRQQVVFLDRDGVINRDSPDYITRLENFEFLPGSLDALRRLADAGFSCIVVTNQTAPARGLMAPETLTEIHDHMTAAVAAAGGHILDIFVCPHLPEEDCACRKPKPGMLLAAQEKHRIDLSSAALIGDSAKDIECAQRAGLAAAVLVQTGNGEKALRELLSRGIRPHCVATDLRAAADWIVAARRPDTV